MPKQHLIRVRLKRDRFRLLVFPTLLVLAGAGGAAAAYTFVPPPNGMLVAGGALFVALLGLVLGAVLMSIRLTLLPGALRISWLGGRRDYRLVAGEVRRLVLPPRGRQPISARFRVFGLAFGRGRLFGVERVSVLKLAPVSSLVLVPTERGRVAVAPIDEVGFASALAVAATHVPSAPAPARPATGGRAPVPVPPPPAPSGRALTGIERARQEAERRAEEERRAAEAQARAEAERRAAAEAAEAARRAEEERRVAAIRAEEERVAAERRAEEERQAAARRTSAERQAADERARVEAAQREADAARRREEERIAAERAVEEERQAALRRVEGERHATEQRRAAAERAQAERRAAAERVEQERRAAAERAAAERRAAQERAAEERRAAAQRAAEQRAARDAERSRRRAQRAAARREMWTKAVRQIRHPTFGGTSAGIGVSMAPTVAAGAVAGVFLLPRVSLLRPAAEPRDLALGLLLVGPLATAGSFLARSGWPRLAGLVALAGIIGVVLLVRAAIG